MDTELVLYPNPVLKKRAQPLQHVDAEVRERVADMFQVMYRERGVGLAAPQVGWSVRLFVMNSTGEPDPEAERVFVNPEVVRAEGEVLEEEGCLSIPKVRGKVLRSERVVLRARDLDGVPVEAELDDLEARCVQHEIDHLDGILFTSRLSPSEKLRVSRELKKLEKEYRKSGAPASR
jgi:peptide deformylase